MGSILLYSPVPCFMKWRYSQICYPLCSTYWAMRVTKNINASSSSLKEGLKISVERKIKNQQIRIKHFTSLMAMMKAKKSSLWKKNSITLKTTLRAMNSSPPNTLSGKNKPINRKNSFVKLTSSSYKRQTILSAPFKTIIYPSPKRLIYPRLSKMV